MHWTPRPQRRTQGQSHQVLCAMNRPSVCRPKVVLKRCTQEKAHFEGMFAVGNAKVHFVEASSVRTSYRSDGQRLRDKGKKEIRYLQRSMFEVA